jgi:hypothetical protein
MLIIQNPQRAHFSFFATLHGPYGHPRLAIAPSAQRE